MGLFKEAFITLRTVVVAVLNVMSFFVVEKVNFLEKFFRTDLKREIRGKSEDETDSFLPRNGILAFQGAFYGG